MVSNFFPVVGLHSPGSSYGNPWREGDAPFEEHCCENLDDRQLKLNAEGFCCHQHIFCIRTTVITYGKLALILSFSLALLESGLGNEMTSTGTGYPPLHSV